MSTYAKTTDSWRCDECATEMAFPLFCDGCGMHYPERKRLSAFALLGVPVRFDLDDSLLDEREVLLAKRLHPDRWQGKSDRLYRRALLAQSAVNEALEAIRKPFSRGDTLLGMQPEVSDGALTASAELPGSFLMEQFGLQEEIEDGVDDGRKRELTKQVRAELKTLRQSLTEAFATLQNDEAEAARVEALTSARDALDRSRYWRNVQRALRGQKPE